ncbi:MAG: hypothetical protein ABL963_15120 [Longimicrobiales bacterium]
MASGAPLGRLASAILIAAALPALGVLALALPRMAGGAGTDQIVFFGVLPALWIVGMGAALRAPAMARLSVALLLVSLGVAVVAAEAVLGLWLRGAAVAATTSSTLPALLDMRAQGIDAFPRIPGNSLVDLNVEVRGESGSWHPLTSSPGETTVVFCNEEGPLVTYAADWAGFDNPREAWSPERVDVVLIGDSYTAGVCVESEHALGGQLRTRWPTINLGASGSGPLQQLAILREYAAQKTPRVVVWVYYEGNDLWDFGRELQRDWLSAYLEPGHLQGLAANQVEVNAGYRSWIDGQVAEASVAAGGAVPQPPPSPWSPREIASFSSLRSLLGFEVLVPSRGPVIGRLPEVLARASDDVAGWGGQLYVAYMPAYARYDALVGEAIAGRRDLFAALESASIPLIDLDAALRAAGDPKSLWASPRGHLSPEGYRVAADAIATAIAPRLTDSASAP